jgi:hypothetical protein
MNYPLPTIHYKLLILFNLQDKKEPLIWKSLVILDRNNIRGGNVEKNKIKIVLAIKSLII